MPLQSKAMIMQTTFAAQSFFFLTIIIMTAIASASKSPANPATNFVANSDIPIKFAIMLKL